MLNTKGKLYLKKLITDNIRTNNKHMEDAKDQIQGKIIVSELTEADRNKTKNDLCFIKLMSQYAKERGARLIVSGGYAVDGSLGSITRPHRDIDIQIFGQTEGSSQLVAELVDKVRSDAPALSGVQLKDKGRQE